MNIYVRPNGAAQCIYDEKLDLGTIGEVDIRRASHVEPDPETPNSWVVDMRPVGGPVVVGFKSRSEAIAFELRHLEQQLTSGEIPLREAASG